MIQKIRVNVAGQPSVYGSVVQWVAGVEKFGGVPFAVPGVLLHVSKDNWLFDPTEETPAPRFDSLRFVTLQREHDKVSVEIVE